MMKKVLFIFLILFFLCNGVASAAFGNGTDGDVTISTSTTLTSDMYYNNLIINSGVALYPDGYIIYIKDTLTISGTINRNGNDGPAYYPHVNTAGLPTRSVGGSGYGGKGGSAGGNPGHGAVGESVNGIANSTGGDGHGYVPIEPFYSTKGGVGGTTSTFYTVTSENLNDIITYASSRLGGPGGGGGGGWYGCGGGGGGSGGGVIYCSANNIVINNDGLISAKGGTAHNYSDAPAAGGGGGGGGGCIILEYASITNNGEINVDGGYGATSMSGGTPGLPGTSGIIYYFIGTPDTPSIITIEVLVQQNEKAYPSTYIQDADSTGGFPNNNGYITLTPNVADTYPLDIQNNLYDGIKLTFVSTDTINNMPLILTGLNPSQNYAVYESGIFQYEFRSTSPNYFYDITTHDEISSFELVKLSSGGGGNGGEDNNEDDEENDDTGIIIIDDIIFIETDIEEEFLVLFTKDPIRTVTTFLSQPTNWLILLGAYIGVYIGMLLTFSKINYLTILFYGTITILIILIIAALGLNLLFLNIIFSSSSFILAFITYTFYGILIGLITGD